MIGGTVVFGSSVFRSKVVFFAIRAKYFNKHSTGLCDNWAPSFKNYCDSCVTKPLLLNKILLKFDSLTFFKDFGGDF
jgi:hypothetical protein